MKKNKLMCEGVVEFARNGIAALKNVDLLRRVEKIRATAKIIREKIEKVWKCGAIGKSICVFCASLLLWIVFCFSPRGGDCAVTFKSVSEWPFLTVFSGNNQTEIGVAYKHAEMPQLKAVHVVEDGVIAAYVKGAGGFLTEAVTDMAECVSKLLGAGSYRRIVHIVTKTKYHDMDNIKSGVYVRTGTYKLKVMNREHVVESFSELLDSSELERVKHLDEEKVAAAVEKAKESEGAPLSLDLPVKSICGFVLGSKPSQNWSLIKENENKPFMHVYDIHCKTEFRGKMKTPFRLFENVELCFSSMWDCLESIEMYTNRLEGDCSEEYEKVKDILEKKFNIKFVRGDSGYCSWRHFYEGTECKEKESIGLTLDKMNNCIRLYVSCQMINELELEAQRNKKKIVLPDNEGIDQL